VVTNFRNNSKRVKKGHNTTPKFTQNPDGYNNQKQGSNHKQLGICHNQESRRKLFKEHEFDEQAKKEDQEAWELKLLEKEIDKAVGMEIDETERNGELPNASKDVSSSSSGAGDNDLALNEKIKQYSEENMKLMKEKDEFEAMARKLYNDKVQMEQMLKQETQGRQAMTDEVNKVREYQEELSREHAEAAAAIKAGYEQLEKDKEKLEKLKEQIGRQHPLVNSNVQLQKVGPVVRKPDKSSTSPQTAQASVEFIIAPEEYPLTVLEDYMVTAIRKKIAAVFKLGKVEPTDLLEYKAKHGIIMLSCANKKSANYILSTVNNEAWF
jgi:hypothetical protein